jgi:two-component system, sensor histidine kinase PdtaS
MSGGMKKYSCLLFFLFAGLASWSQQASRFTKMMEELAHSKEDTNRVNLQLRIAGYYMNTNPTPQYLDSAAFFHDQALQLSIKLHEPGLQYKVLEQVAHRFFRARDSARTRQTFNRVIAWYHQSGQLANEARAWHQLAERYGHYNDSEYLNETISYFQRARSIYLQINQPIEAANELAAIAYRRIFFKQFDVAEKELQQALDQFKASGYVKLQLTYRYLYELHYNKGNYYRAMAFLMEAIKNMSVDGDSLQGPAYYMLVAECNTAVKKYDEAIEWLRKASVANPSYTTLKLLVAQNLLALNRTEEARLTLDDVSKQQSKKVYVDSLIQHWTFALYYKSINNPDKAIRHYLQVKRIIDRTFHSEHENNGWYVKCNNGIAEAWLKANEPAKAETYLNNAASIFKNSKTSLDPALLADYYGHLYKYNMATGDHAAAVTNLEQQVKIRDSLFTADKDKQLAELNIQYETAQKEQSIKNLRSQGTAQQAETEKATLQRNITIAGILAMIVVSFLFYRNYQQKKAANAVISHKNALLERLVTEKEWLLKEVHHRVKNNLQTIISLLQSQANYLQDDALEANQISKNRIYAMSLIHQQLYRTENMKSIGMSVFLPELLEHLRESFGTERQIHFHHAISPVKLGVSQAIPIALIVNESVTNAIKYAFPGDRPGNINISMRQTGERITLIIADDGIGVDPAIIDKETNSLGMKLLKGLTEDIDGDITITNENGTTISIRFNSDPLTELNAISENN